jgi:prepilin-type N-terminal cleavage/methylation domain-containing protein
MKTLFARLQELRNEGRQNEDGFTLIELLVTIMILGITGTAATSLIINMTQTAAEFNNPEDCFNQGMTAERLCQIQQIAIGVKGTNELTPLDRDMVLPNMAGRDDPASLIWQVGTTVGGDVCIVGYDLNDSTSKFTHAKPFVYATTYKAKARGIGCGTRNSNGTYTWADDPTIPKAVKVLAPNAPDPVRLVDPVNNVVNGNIDSMRDGQTLHFVMTKAYGAVTGGATLGYVTFDANYVCSNGYTKTERIQADMLTSGSNVSWKGHVYTYGDTTQEKPCNPTSVSLTPVSGAKWTLGNTENFTFH